MCIRDREALVAMVVPHAARAYATERQVVLPRLHDRLINADAAGDDLGDVVLG